LKGWSTRPEEKKKKRKEALKKEFASLHHRRNFSFVITDMDDPSR
jgi:hypothetical protein